MKQTLTFHERDRAVQAVKEDLQDVCAALGLSVSKSVAVVKLREVMRARLVELNGLGILPPEGPYHFVCREGCGTSGGRFFHCCGQEAVFAPGAWKGWTRTDLDTLKRVGILPPGDQP